MLSTEEINARWERAWEEAPEFERRRFEQLDRASALAVLYLVPGGVPLGEAIKKAAKYEGRLDRR